jgi:hypothetical protein
MENWIDSNTTQYSKASEIIEKGVKTSLAETTDTLLKKYQKMAKL